MDDRAVCVEPTLLLTMNITGLNVRPADVTVYISETPCQR
jgi:hypothetical protein